MELVALLLRGRQKGKQGMGGWKIRSLSKFDQSQDRMAATPLSGSEGACLLGISPVHTRGEAKCDNGLRHMPVAGGEGKRGEREREKGHNPQECGEPSRARPKGFSSDLHFSL